jgi:hypothetical protein
MAHFAQAFLGCRRQPSVRSARSRARERQLLATCELGQSGADRRR